MRIPLSSHVRKRTLRNRRLAANRAYNLPVQGRMVIGEIDGSSAMETWDKNRPGRRWTLLIPLQLVLLRRRQQRRQPADQIPHRFLDRACPESEFIDRFPIRIQRVLRQRVH